jgi:chromate transporter
LKDRARALKRETYALYLAVRDPRTPWYARAVAAAVVAYALSPLDLIPDFIPVIGYLDDLILVPLGIALALRLIPEPVMRECRERAAASDGLPWSRRASPTRSQGHLGEVAGLFLKLGLIGFGGPAAHIAMMRQEVVQRRQWLSEQEFLDLLGASNLIPGPTSTELAIYLGYRRAGPAGLVLAGLLFILPAMVLVLAFAWAYVRYGSTPQVAGVLYGIKPVIIAVIVQAIYGLLRTAIKTWALGVVVVLTVVLYAAGLNPLVPLFGLSITAMLIQNRARLPRGASPAALALPFQLAQTASAHGLASFSLGVLFLTFLKIGATLYGSGYVLLAFLHDDFVNRLGWLTDQQLLDAVAVGQVTPGPVFTTATFIGYLVGGLPGALVATVAVFLPSFVFVASVYPFVPRLRASPWTSAFLDGANAAAVGLMVAVAWQLGTTSIVDGLTAGLLLVAAAVLIRWRLNSVWLVLGGGAAGFLATALRSA